MRRRVWCETLPFEELCAPGVLHLLARFHLELLLAVRPWQLAEIPGVVARLRDAGVVVALWPDLWSALFTSDPGVLAAARSYFTWAAPTYALYGIGLCLFFASQGAGKMLWPVLAGSIRLLVIAIGGYWLIGFVMAEKTNPA